MALVPLSYNLRSLWVRRGSTLLTVVGIAATVAMLAAVLSFQQGFRTIFSESGRDDLLVFTRQGSTDEAMSIIPVDSAEVLMKQVPEIDVSPTGEPLAAAEMYLAIARKRVSNGALLYVPIRGVQPKSLEINAGRVRVTEGRMLEMGTDEIVVGRKLVGRVEDCSVGSVLLLNTTPLKVVGVLDSDGPFANEIWGDVERLKVILDREMYSRVIAKARPGIDVAELAERQRDDKQAPVEVMTELDFNVKSTRGLTQVFLILGAVLGTIMGTSAVFAGTNTMLAAVASRSHEIGVLKALGFRPWAVFASFLLESVALCLFGGLLGCVFTLPFNGLTTSTMSFNSFTDVSFAFRTTPVVLATAVGFSILLGIVGGAWPAWRAARLDPTDAMRRE
jgi:ABC-type antimicrobial peptide transport system permease subunit